MQANSRKVQTSGSFTLTGLWDWRTSRPLGTITSCCDEQVASGGCWVLWVPSCERAEWTSENKRGLFEHRTIDGAVNTCQHVKTFRDACFPASCSNMWSQQGAARPDCWRSGGSVEHNHPDLTLTWSHLTVHQSVYKLRCCRSSQASGGSPGERMYPSIDSHCCSFCLITLIAKILFQRADNHSHNNAGASANPSPKLPKCCVSLLFLKSQLISVTSKEQSHSISRKCN